MVCQEDGRPDGARPGAGLPLQRSPGLGRLGSFEWAVTAVASMAVHLTSHSYAVHLVSTETAADGRAGETIDVDTALDALAVAEMSTPQQMDQVLHAAHPLTSAGGLVIAVVTDSDEDTLRRVASLRQPGGTGLLLLLEAATYAARERRPSPPAPRHWPAWSPRPAGARRWCAPAPTSRTVWDALTTYSGIPTAVGR